MIAGSLFSGIEGFGLGLLWSGLITEIAFQVEIDPFCRRVLEARFPHVDRSVQDVRLATAQSLPSVDVLFGGFPCTDISYAGIGAGLAGKQSGLWFEFARIIGELRPRVVIVENVAALLGRGLLRVLGGLAALGYDARWRIISAEECGAPHRRERLFIIAYRAMADADRGRRDERTGAHGERAWSADPADRDHDVANPAGIRRKRDQAERGISGARKNNRRLLKPSRASDWFIESNVVSRPDEFPARVVRWPAGPGAPQEAWEPPRVLAGVEERGAKLKAIGNAVSPIQAYHVGLWAIDVLKREGVI